jgi:hypothetical protein
MAFQRFSQTNMESLEILRPNLGLRSWNDFSKPDRAKIWRYLEKFLYSPERKEVYKNGHRSSPEFIFDGGDYDQEITKERVMYSIYALNDEYKAKSYGSHFLQSYTYDCACMDFHNIFINNEEAVVLEMLSFYIEFIFKKADTYGDEKAKYDFKQFASTFNETLSHFNFKYELTEMGFVPVNDKKIQEDIYEPIIEILGNSKWKEVNDHLRDAFSDFRKNTKEDYSTCVTKTISAIQAFLQITVHGTTGKGDISNLITLAQNRKLIPYDEFSISVLDNLEKIFARIRQDASDAHPKKYYATESNAKLVLNLTMVFLQHCLL